MIRKYAAVFVVGALALASVSFAQDAGDGTAIANPFRGVMQDRSADSDVEGLYVEKCSMCHRRMGMGTVLLARRVPAAEAELENRQHITAQYVILAARQGIGNMPRISRAEVSDEQLRQIADYLASETQP